MNKYDETRYLIRNVHNHALCICELMNQLEHNMTHDDVTEDLLGSLHQALSDLTHLNMRVFKIDVKEI